MWLPQPGEESDWESECREETSFWVLRFSLLAMTSKGTELCIFAQRGRKHLDKWISTKFDPEMKSRSCGTQGPVITIARSKGIPSFPAWLRTQISQHWVLYSASTTTQAWCWVPYYFMSHLKFLHQRSYLQNVHTWKWQHLLDFLGHCFSYGGDHLTLINPHLLLTIICLGGVFSILPMRKQRFKIIK